MALDKLTIINNGGLSTTSDYRVGVLTAIKFVGPIESESATFTGSVSIGGTLTYEDVTNIDSVGLVTARDGIFLPDTKKAQFGNTAADPDLEIYHGGTASYISHSGTGNLFIHSDTVAIRKQNQQAYFVGVNGQSKLYEGGSERLVTTDKGITVGTGVTIETNGNSNFVGVSSLGTGATGAVYLYNPDADALSGTTNDIYGWKAKTYESGLQVNSTLYLSRSGSNGLSLGYNNATGSSITANSGFMNISVPHGPPMYLRAFKFYLQNGHANATFAEINTDASANNEVKLFYGNVKKFETVSSGVNVVGTTTTTQLAVTGVSTFTGDIKLSVDGLQALAVKNFGYSGSYKSIMVGNPNSNTGVVALNVDVSGISGSQFHAKDQVVTGYRGFLTPNAAGNNFIGVFSRDGSADKIYFGPSILSGLPNGPITATTSNVGINVTDPDSTLEINKGSEGRYLRIGGDNASNGRALTFTSSTGNTGSNGALHTISATSGNGAIALDTGGTERLHIDASGDVKVTSRGSNNSGAPFYVAVTGKSSVDYSGGGDDTACLRIVDNGTNNSYFHGLELRTKQGGDVRLYAQDKGNDVSDFVVAVDNSGLAERLRISSGGQVRMNTAGAPAADLHVGGTGESLNAYFQTSRVSGAYHHYAIGNSGATLGYIGSAGQISSTGSSTGFAFRSQGHLEFCSGGSTQRVRITNGGNVQIVSRGSTTPGAPLYVAVTGKSSVTYAGGNDDTACVRIEDEGSSDGYYHGLEFRTKRSGDTRIYAQDIGQNLADLVFATDSGSGGSAGIKERLRITSDGIVDITGKLRIDIASSGGAGSGTAEGIFLRNTTESDNNAVTIFGGADDYNTAASAINFVNVDHSANYGDITFDTRGSGGYSERLRITSTGLVKIDEASPVAGTNGENALLQVKSTSQYDGLLLGHGYGYGTIGKGSGGALIYTGNASPGNLGGTETIMHDWWSGSAGGGGPNRLMMLTTSGNVSIGGRDEALSNYAAGNTTTKLAVVDNGAGSGYHEVAHFTAGTDSNDTGAIVRITQFNNDRGLYIKAGRGSGDRAKAIFGLRNSGATDSDKLTINQSGEIEIATRNSGNTGDFTLKIGSFGIRTEDTGGYNWWRIDRNYGGMNPFIAMRADGRIGIGEENPDRRLHLKDPAQIKLESTGTGNWSGLQFMASSGTNNYDAYMGMQDSDGVFFIDNNSNGIDFSINRDGKVQIGPIVNGGAANVLDMGNATGNRGISFGGESFNYTNIWTEYGSGDLWLACGLRPVGTSAGFYSSYGSAMGRAAIQIDAFGNDGIHFYTSTGQTVAKDGAITVNERVHISGGGITRFKINKNSTAVEITTHGDGTHSFGDEARLDFLMKNEVNQSTGNPAARIASYLQRGNNGYGLKFYVRYSAGTFIESLNLTADYHVLPGVDGTADLGSTSKRWRDVYTSDLDLSNETKGGNSIDGTWGSYKIEEGEDDLFIINRRNGKKYKFNLTEVS